MAWLASPALAEPPNLLTYQGRLKESGSPVTGGRSVEILLCDALTSGTCTSTGAQGVSVANGLFKTTFTMPSAVNLGSGVWYLEVKVGADTYVPRERLGSSPYALHAATAAYLQAAPNVAGVTVSSHMFVAGNVGVGTSTPTAKLHVEGNVRIVDGTQGASKVLTSDSNGNASWQALGSGYVKIASGSASFSDTHSVSANINHDTVVTVGFTPKLVECWVETIAASPNWGEKNNGELKIFSNGDGWSWQAGALHVYSGTQVPESNNQGPGSGACTRTTDGITLSARCMEANQGTQVEFSLVNFTSTDFTIRFNHIEGSAAAYTGSGNARCLVFGE